MERRDFLKTSASFAVTPAFLPKHSLARAIAAPPPLPAPGADGWVSLINGRDLTGWYTMLEEHLALPFDTTVLGVVVKVAGLDLRRDNDIVAICTRGRERQSVPILALPLPSPRPAGAEWIEAYRHWIGG